MLLCIRPEQQKVPRELPALGRVEVAKLMMEGVKLKVSAVLAHNRLLKHHSHGTVLSSLC